LPLGATYLSVAALKPEQAISNLIFKFAVNQAHALIRARILFPYVAYTLLEQGARDTLSEMETDYS
jgi:hypothetical protein